MDVASILSIGILCFLSGVSASLLPLSKARNYTDLFPLAGALALLVCRQQPEYRPCNYPHGKPGVFAFPPTPIAILLGLFELIEKRIG
jgi:hypothetical protein